MEAINLALFGLLYLVSSVESNQYYHNNSSLLARKVQNLETQVQIFSTLLQIQSTIISKYINQGEVATGTTSPDNRVTITKQANEIKDLQGKVAALENLRKTQEMIRGLSDNFEKLIKAISTVSTGNTSGTVDVAVLNQKVSALERNCKTQDSQMKRLESTMTSSNMRIDQNQEDRKALANVVKAQDSQISQLHSSVQQGTWASGKYCILASGSCPEGFTRVTAWMKAMKVFRGSRRFLQQANFGDSNIRCYGPCARSDQWLGELTIVACCK